MYSREFAIQLELLVLRIASQDDGLVAGVVQTVFVQLMLEVVLGANGEHIRAGVLLGHLQHTVAPVVGALGVLGIVHRVVGDHEGVLEVGG